ncbi:MAG: TonB-dependent receptor [Bacteroidetes bacterium]|nr:TonB-dependent receptor [Bacteroidota bacterium]
MPGATIILIGTDPLIGTISDADGNFRLEKIIVGRVDIVVSMIGYEPVSLRNYLLTSGKELLLTVRMDEKIYQLSDIEVRPELEKHKPLNELAMVSARSFTVEETERYAGSLGDPSRMAANFAGVSSPTDQRNDIVIRGNSPFGLLWRLEGIDIPNPNHFGTMGSTGGPVSILNNNLLDNSDFYTGAFPAEFGNAMAGVFDLRLRNGNNEKREFTGQVGFNGFELGAEGPIFRWSKSSFLANFRYSTLELLRSAGLSFGTGQAVPQYKDLAFKVNIPLKSGKISVFGIGGISRIEMLDSQGDSASYGFSGTDLRFGASMGVIGINHLHFISEQSRLSTHLAITGLQNTTDMVDLGHDKEIPVIVEDDHELTIRFSTGLHHRFNARNFVHLGTNCDLKNARYVGKQYHWDIDRYVYYMNGRGLFSFVQAYTDWLHRFSNNLSTSIGLHSSFLLLNNGFALEPRLATRWTFKPGQFLSFATGMHSQTQPTAVYLMEELVDTSQMVYQRTNKDVGFSRSLHFVAGYDRLLGEGHRLKTEVYYQWLYHIPVSHQRPEYAALNHGGAFGYIVFHELVNQGKGKNYGIELTLEKFLRKGFYYLITASMFESHYCGFDSVWRNTAYNNNFVINALGGFEWSIGKRSHIALDLKTVYAGGNRYLPVDVEQSLKRNGVVYDWKHAYENRYPDYFRMNARISYHLNGEKINQQWAIDLQNLTNQKNIFTQNWNNSKRKLVTSYQMGFMPMLTYKIHF